MLKCESTADGGVCDVYLVGTAHVPMVPTTGEMVLLWKKNQNLFGILYSWFLAEVARKLEVLPGAEFHVNLKKQSSTGARSDLVIDVSKLHCGEQGPGCLFGLFGTTKLSYSLLVQAVFLPTPEELRKWLKKMDDVNMLTLVIQEMSKQFPTLMETLVHERDQYMSASLLIIAREHNSVVAIVGKGHLPGIQKNWKLPVEVKQLLSIPSENNTIPVGKILSTIGVTVAGVAIISGLYLSIKK